jgi:uncharacterized membrane protein
MDYLVVKWIHVLSSTFLFGTGVGSAFYLLLASRQADARIAAFVTRRVVWADWLFTATTALIQPLSGAWLVQRAGFPWSAPWLRWSLLLYAFAIACWLPVVVLQQRLRDIAAGAARNGTPLPPRYRKLFLCWMALGFPALLAFLAIFWLMVAMGGGLGARG